MAKVISICQHKGGVGKTTSTANIGAALALKGYKTLLIDLDPQANLTKIVGMSPEQDKNIYTMLKGEAEMETFEVSKKLSIIPSDITLFEAERFFVGQGREIKLKKLVDAVSQSFDVILLDCCPGIGTLLTMSLLASTDAILPVETEFLALRGIHIITDLIKDIRELNPELKLRGAFATKFDSRRAIDKQVLSDLQGVFKDLAFKTAIRKNVALVEAGAMGKTIFNYAPKSHGAEDYKELTKEIIKRVIKNV